MERRRPPETPAESSDSLDAESIAYRELHELPADPEKIGPVIDPDLLDDEAVPTPPAPAPSQLQEVLDQLVSDDDLHRQEEMRRSENFIDRMTQESESSAQEEVVEAVLERPPLEGESFSAAARGAYLVGSNVLPLATSETINDKSEIDSTVYMLSSFSDLQYGQLGVVRVSVRSRPGFKDQGRAWLSAAKVGENIDSKKSIPKKITSWISYFASRIAYDINSMGSHGPRSDPPVSPRRRGQGLKPIPASQVSPEEKAAWKAAESKARDQAHFETQIAAVVLGGPDDQADCEQIAETAISGLEMFDSEFGVQKITWRETQPYDALLGLMGAREPEDIGMILSAEELAAIAHIPDDSTSIDGVRAVRSSFKTLPISNPLVIPDLSKIDPGLVPLGIQNPNSEEAQVVAMRNSDLDRHMLMVGKTGSGKSELMKWLVYGVARSNYPLVLVDPHGQLCGDILKALIVNAPDRIDDIVYCDLSDPEFPVAFNPLDIDNQNLVEPTVNSVAQMLQVQLNLDSSSAPRATLFAKTALTALCEANLRLGHTDPDTRCTLLDVLQFFTDPEFRQLVVHFARNLAVKQNFDPDIGPFEQMSEKQQGEMSMPINRAFSTLAASESFSAVFSSGRNKLNLGGLIQQNKIVLIRLARFSHQAQLGEFVGALVVPWLLSSMDTWGRHRDDITGESTGSGCRIFVDEAPRVFAADSSVPELLAEARKWDLGMVMAAQFIEQFPKSIIQASLNNTGSKIGLHCDPKAAGEISRAVAGATKTVTETDMATMPNFHFYGNVMLPSAGGALAPSGPFSAKCLPMISDDLGEEGLAMREYVIENSRKLICNSMSDVLAKRDRRVEDIKSALVTELNREAQPDFDSPEVLPDDAGPGEDGFDWAMS